MSEYSDPRNLPDDPTAVEVPAPEDQPGAAAFLADRETNEAALKPVEPKAEPKAEPGAPKAEEPKTEEKK